MEIWPLFGKIWDGTGRALDWGLGETGSWTDWGRAGTLRRRTASTSQRHQQAPSLPFGGKHPSKFPPIRYFTTFSACHLFFGILVLCAQSLYFCVLDNVGFEDRPLQTPPSNPRPFPFSLHINIYKLFFSLLCRKAKHLLNIIPP